MVLMRGESSLNPVATCREYSRSAWLHFPHVELVFLFFAFEGAVASQASVIRNRGCAHILWAAVAVLVSPAPFAVTTSRTGLSPVFATFPEVSAPHRHSNRRLCTMLHPVFSRL